MYGVRTRDRISRECVCLSKELVYSGEGENEWGKQYFQTTGNTSLNTDRRTQDAMETQPESAGAKSILPEQVTLSRVLKAKRFTSQTRRQTPGEARCNGNMDRGFAELHSSFSR